MGYIEKYIDKKDIKEMTTRLKQLEYLKALEDFNLSLGVSTWLTEFDNENDTTTYVLYLENDNSGEWTHEIYFEDENLYFNDLTNNKLIKMKVGIKNENKESK